MALGLSGCMHSQGPVATMSSPGELDVLAYGAPSPPAPREAYAQIPVVYATPAAATDMDTYVPRFSILNRCGPATFD